LEIARDIDSKCFERGDVKRMERAGAAGLWHAPRIELNEAGQETRERLAAARRCDQERGFSGKPKFREAQLMRARCPAARLKPRGELRRQRKAATAFHPFAQNFCGVRHIKSRPEPSDLELARASCHSSRLWRTVSRDAKARPAFEQSEALAF